MIRMGGGEKKLYWRISYTKVVPCKGFSTSGDEASQGLQWTPICSSTFPAPFC